MCQSCGQLVAAMMKAVSRKMAQTLKAWHVHHVKRNSLVYNMSTKKTDLLLAALRTDAFQPSC